MREFLIGFLLKTFKSLEKEDVDNIKELIASLRQKDYVRARDVIIAFISQTHFAVDHIDL